jgi:serine/threonine-protein kinase
VSFLAEIRRRNVIRMAGLYLVAAWLAVQVASTLLPAFDAPAWTLRAVILVLAVGFIPALVFAWVFELTPEGLKRDSEVPIEQSIAPRTARRLDRAIIAVLAAALVYFAIDKFVLAPHREAAAPEQVAKKAESIAVLPLANEGGDKDQQYFADGLSENLITALSRYGALKVISRNSAFQFRDSSDSSRSIGEKLGVAHLLEGSVRRLGDTVRINAALVLASDGSTLWSEHYDRPYVDLFKLQDDITSAVASALKARLVDSAAGTAQIGDRPPSGDLAAYDAYMHGRYFDDKRTSEDFETAFGFFEQATKRDPQYAQAWAAYASAKVLQAGTYLGGAQARAAVADARRMIDRALSLAPDSAYVNMVNSRVLSNGELKFVEAESAATRAIGLARTAETIGELSLTRAWLGDARGAEALQREAIEYDRAYGNAWFWLSVNLAGQGRLDEADVAIARAMERAPNAGIGQAQRVVIEILRGNHAKAMELAMAVSGRGWRLIAIAFAAQNAGDQAAADRALEDLIGQSAEESAYQIAEVYALRRDPTQMFAWLDRAWTNRDPGIRRLALDPFIAPYHGDPRFDEFRLKVGLPALTRSGYAAPP